MSHARIYVALGEALSSHDFMERLDNMTPALNVERTVLAVFNQIVIKGGTGGGAPNYNRPGHFCTKCTPGSVCAGGCQQLQQQLALKELPWIKPSTLVQQQKGKVYPLDFAPIRQYVQASYTAAAYCHVLPLVREGLILRCAM